MLLMFFYESHNIWGWIIKGCQCKAFSAPLLQEIYSASYSPVKIFGTFNSLQFWEKLNKKIKQNEWVFQDRWSLIINWFTGLPSLMHSLLQSHCSSCSHTLTSYYWHPMLRMLSTSICKSFIMHATTTQSIEVCKQPNIW